MLAVTTAALYFHRLGSATPYLAVEERTQARQSVVLASTGRNDEGERFPLYFPEADYRPGRDPAWVYVGAALLKMRPFSERIVRSPSAAAAVLNVVLMFLVGGELFGSTAAAVCAAALLALTPAHFMHGRIATAQIATVTTTLAWLWLLLRYLNRHDLRTLILATFCLGAGAYFYLGAWISIPAFFAVTGIAVVGEKRTDPSMRAQLFAASAGLAVAVLPLVTWHIVHSERIAQLAGYYNRRDQAADLDLRPAITHIFTWWRAFDPGAMFFSGESDYRFSTRTVGYFLLPLALPMLAGLWSPDYGSAPMGRRVVLCGFVLGPFPAAVGNNVDLKHWLTFLPFAICVATAGVQWLMAGGRGAGRSAAVGLPLMVRWLMSWPAWVLAIATGGLWWLAGRRRAGIVCTVTLALIVGIQASSFFRYYFEHYGPDTADSFGGNLSGAVRTALSVTGPHDCIRLDDKIYDIFGAWTLYSRAYRREDLTDRPNGLGPDLETQWDASCRGATVLTTAGDRRFAEWQTIAVPEAKGPARIAVYHRGPR